MTAHDMGAFQSLLQYLAPSIFKFSAQVFQIAQLFSVYSTTLAIFMALSSAWLSLLYSVNMTFLTLRWVTLLSSLLLSTWRPRPSCHPPRPGRTRRCRSSCWHSLSPRPSPRPRPPGRSPRPPGQKRFDNGTKRERRSDKEREKEWQRRKRRSDKRRERRSDRERE